MECPRCGFENMPGLAACARCRAVLTLTEKIVVTPPRAGLGKSLRPLLYGWRRLTGHVPGMEPGRPLLTRLFGPSDVGWIDLAAFFLSIVPGLGHLVCGRWRSGRRLAAAWLAAAAVGLLIFGMIPGIILIGAAIALHAWIMIDAGDLRRTISDGFRRSVFAVALLLVLALGPYNLIRIAIGRHVSGAYSSIDIAEDRIERGDFLLIDPAYYARAGPARGEVAVASIERKTVAPETVFRGGRVMGQILALPGDTVKIRGVTIRVLSAAGASLLEREAAPLLAGPIATGPAGDPGGGESIVVPEGHCFLNAQFFEPRQGRPVFRRNVLDMAVVPQAALQGRAYMVYSPPWRMHWLE